MELNTYAIRKSFTLNNWNPCPLLLDHEGRHAYFAGSPDNPGVRRIDIRTGLTEEVLGPSSPTHVQIKWRMSNTVEPLAVSPDDRDIVIHVQVHGAGVGDAVVWNLQARTERFFMKDVCCAAISPDGHQLAGTDGETIGIWDFSTGQRICQMPCPVRPTNSPASVLRLAFSPDGKFLVAGIAGGVNRPSFVGVWHVADYTKRTVFRCDSNFLRAICFIRGRKNWSLQAGTKWSAYGTWTSCPGATRTIGARPQKLTFEGARGRVRQARVRL